MLEVRFKKSFVKDSRIQEKRGKNLKKLRDVVKMLQENKPLPPKYKDYPLVGNWIGHRECHIEPDWLLVYKIEKNELILVLCHTGTHSDIF